MMGQAEVRRERAAVKVTRGEMDRTMVAAKVRATRETVNGSLIDQPSRPATAFALMSRSTVMRKVPFE